MWIHLKRSRSSSRHLEANVVLLLDPSRSFAGDAAFSNDVGRRLLPDHTLLCCRPALKPLSKLAFANISNGGDWPNAKPCVRCFGVTCESMPSCRSTAQWLTQRLYRDRDIAHSHGLRASNWRFFASWHLFVPIFPHHAEPKTEAPQQAHRSLALQADS